MTRSNPAKDVYHLLAVVVAVVTIAALYFAQNRLNTVCTSRSFHVYSHAGGTAARTRSSRQGVFESIGGCAYAWSLRRAGLGVSPSNLGRW